MRRDAVVLYLAGILLIVAGVYGLTRSKSATLIAIGVSVVSFTRFVVSSERRD